MDTYTATFAPLIYTKVASLYFYGCIKMTKIGVDK